MFAAMGISLAHGILGRYVEVVLGMMVTLKNDDEEEVLGARVFSR